MLTLPNNCRAGSFSVSPRNWKSQSAKVNSIWKITYWFYDDNLGQKKKIVIKGGNRLATLKEKQDYVREMIEYETDLLVNKGYNYITKTYAVRSDAEVTGATPVLQALDYAFSKLECESISDVKSALKYIKKEIVTLHYDRLKIADINLMHVSTILDKACAGKSASTYNHYKSYLSMLYKPLLKMFAVTTNPLREIEKKRTTRPIRRELSKEERAIIRRFLSINYPSFWRFINLFFHSSSRETEIMKLRKEDVDLVRLRFKVTVLKRKQPAEEWRPIKHIAFPHWLELFKLAKEGDYLFSEGLVPGPRKIRVEQINIRWRTHVKKKLGIDVDMYTLKHTNLDETAEAIAVHEKAIKVASVAAGHTTPVVTMKVYTQGENARRHDTIREVANEF